MRLAARLAPALFALSLAGPLFAQTPPPATISVTGEGRVEATPDVATISLGLTSTADTAAAAMAENAAGVQAVLANLAAAGIAPRDVQTSGLSLNPNWTGYGSSGEQRITGYTAQNMVTVRVRALDSLGGVLDAAVKDGANTLNGLGFGLAEPGPALDEARKRAVADAARKAAMIAEAAGVKLGRILQISEGGMGGNGPQPMFRADAASVPIASGEVSFDATVSVVWAIAE